MTQLRGEVLEVLRGGEWSDGCHHPVRLEAGKWVSAGGVALAVGVMRHPAPRAARGEVSGVLEELHSAGAVAKTGGMALGPPLDPDATYRRIGSQ